jgi:hypothetical protein
LAPGNYSVIVSDSLACIDTIYFNIAPSIAMNINTIAKNANCDTTNGIIYTTINNGVNPLQYAWSNGSNTANVYNLAAGIYTVLATDAIGCTVTSLVVINDDGKPYAAITNFQLPLCAGDSSGILTLVAFSGVGPYKYSLDGINFVSSPTLLNVAAGTYTLYVKDANTWEKENGKKEKLTKMIQHVAHKNVKQIPEWQKEHPDFKDSESIESEKYLKIVGESMGGTTEDDDINNYNKIITKKTLSL